MEYTVATLARLSGVSARTLRFYDEIGLLRPARVRSSGYRIYGRAEVDLLQQILFYRELGFPLEEIKKVLTDPGFDTLEALRSHREKLLKERARLDAVITNVEKSIRNARGEIALTDSEKFEGFKQRMIQENDQKYGEEIRRKYGEEAVEGSSRKLAEMTKQEYDEVQALGDRVIETLIKACQTGDPAGESAQRAADLHRQWLSYFWDGYSKDAHAGVARMYVDDPRFTAYYDRYRPGLAAFLRDAVLIYTGQKTD